MKIIKKNKVRLGKALIIIAGLALLLTTFLPFLFYLL
jgi:hypothetical protein